MPLPLPHRMKRRSRVGLGFVLGAVCMLGAVFGIRWLAVWAGRERNGNTASLRSAGDLTESIPKETASAPGSPSPSTTTTAAQSSVGSGAAPLQEGGSSVAVGSSAVDAVRGDDAAEKKIDRDAETAPSGLATTNEGEDDEARLLGRVVPDAATVIGQDEAEVRPTSRTRSSAQAGKRNQVSAAAAGKTTSERDLQSPRGQPARQAASAKPRSSSSLHATGPSSAHAQPVQIRITSSPLGAVVRTKKQVLGRTPLAIRFNPGDAYELTFVKSGYVTNSRRLYVARGKTQSISVAMKKAPAPPHRNFFLRGR